MIASGSSLVLLMSAVVVVGIGSQRPVAASTAPTDGATRGADNLRTGWYPDQTDLTPSVLNSGTFGQLFDTSVNGEVYGQPLLDDNQVLVNTQNDYAYGLDPVTGAILWSRQFGSPVPESTLGCADEDTYGIESTAVVDQSTNTEYLVDLQFVSGSSGPMAFYMHALNLDKDGAEESGFPVEIQGTAANDPEQTFTPNLENQRAGLLLLGGVVYVGFAAHCDIGGYQGWIVGVSESGTISTLWTDAANGTSAGGGIWMSGGGLVSDGPGTILFSTGNGISAGDTPNGTIPGDDPPADLGESVVRVDVQPNGSLKAVDFFAPYDAPALDGNDLDFGSGSPISLPSPYFGTPSFPNLAVAVGKEGYVYLLNRDNLGGEGEGPSGTDDVVGRYGPNGGVWSSPAVWPGDGGWVYIPTASGSPSAGGSAGFMDAYQYGLSGSGNPTLNLAGKSSDAFGFGSSAPVVTSNGTTSGSALMWVVWSPDASGIGAQLRAYDPVPVDGVLQEVWSAPVGTASKFNPPGIGGNRVYVGTRGGSVLGFGSPVPSPVTAASPTFPTTVVGHSTSETLTVTANADITISGLSVSPGAFTLGAPSPSLPAQLNTGDSLTVPVTFTPTTSGQAGASVTVTTEENGTAQIPLSATGEESGPDLGVTTNGISFGGIPPGSQTSQEVGFFNSGSSALTISSVALPDAPFGTSGAPSVGDTISGGAEVFVNVTFAPTAVGMYSSSLEIDSDGGDEIVTLTGNSTAPSVLTITPASINYANVDLGQSALETFKLTDTGGSSLEISKSKPPAKGTFTALTSLAEGTTMSAGSSLTESVRFAPREAGSTSDQWVITADDGHGEHDVTFTGIGVPPTVKTTGLPAATQSVPYATTLTASGGTAPYRWSLTSGALPYGLSLDAATGTITGTPVAAGAYSFVVKTVGSGGFSGSAKLAITVLGTPETLNSATVGMASTPDGNGYWITDTAGEVRTDGDAGFYGSMAGRPLNAPIAHIVATADAHGYWLVASDGGTFAFGDAPFYGSMAGYPLNKPIVDIAPTPDGRGYWLVASDGGIFAFGDAIFRGSMGGTPLNKPVVGMAPNPVTGGYWLVASDGGIFGFDASFFGSTGSLSLNRPVNGMAVAPGGVGYWLVASDGGIFAFGRAGFHGSTGALALSAPVVGMAPDAVTGGYWLVASDGGIFAFDAPFFGSATP
ncbi:MAG: choice-of-anchor D domain-containing protein [Acidimicrobiales bacterium]